MREDVEKLVFDALHEVADPKHDSWVLRKYLDDIMDEHDKTVQSEIEEQYQMGYEDGEGDGDWKYQDGFDEGYQEGYDQGVEDTANAKEDD